jgi:phenylacetate-CoA ligase
LQWYSFIEKSQWWSKEELENYQWQKIKLLLDYVYIHVPYYTELFNKIGAKPPDIKTWLDFEKIPCLTKDIIRERPDDLISTSRKNKSKLRYYTTGGSTGEPVGFYKSSDIDIIESAFMHQQWKRVGYNEKSSRIILRGEPVKNNPLFQKFRFSNDWLVSSYHLSERYIKQYVDFLNKIKPDFFHVYPSSLYIFTRLLIDSKLSLNFSPRAILCGSEPVRNYQRELFEKTYNAKIYSWLGLSEGVILAGECEYSTDYHAWPQHSYIEILNKENKSVNNKGGTGEIIGTALNNFAYPFIRYRSGDIGEYTGCGCPLCKRNFPLLRKVDRWLQEIIVSKNGVYVSATGLNTHTDIFDNVVQFQFFQNIPGELVLNLVKKNSYTEKDSVKIINELQKKIGNEFDISLSFMNNIPRSETGKHRYLVQNLKLELFNNK